jgi:hypothetical protein
VIGCGKTKSRTVKHEAAWNEPKAEQREGNEMQPVRASERQGVDSQCGIIIIIIIVRSGQIVQYCTGSREENRVQQNPEKRRGKER